MKGKLEGLKKEDKSIKVDGTWYKTKGSVFDFANVIDIGTKVRFETDSKDVLEYIQNVDKEKKPDKSSASKSVGMKVQTEKFEKRLEATEDKLDDLEKEIGDIKRKINLIINGLAE